MIMKVTYHFRNISEEFLFHEQYASEAAIGKTRIKRSRHETATPKTRMKRSRHEAAIATHELQLQAPVHRGEEGIRQRRQEHGDARAHATEEQPASRRWLDLPRPCGRGGWRGRGGRGSRPGGEKGDTGGEAGRTA